MLLDVIHALQPKEVVPVYKQTIICCAPYFFSVVYQAALVKFSFK
jgi:hypothetical protein